MKYSSDIYKKETKMCAKMFKEKQGCAWGKCAECGVIPLLHKLENGEILEKEEKIKELKNKILTN